jgi:glucose-6-phosphate 1-epimerase
MSFHGLYVINKFCFLGLLYFSSCILSSVTVLYSDKAIFEQGKAIRGGVPIVWPQFGPGPLPQHGFARVKTWSLGKTNTASDVSVELHLSHDEDTLKIWPHKFDLTITIRLSEQSFSQELTVNNRDDHAFEFSALFHTYFTVDNIKTTKM